MNEMLVAFGKSPEALLVCLPFWRLTCCHVGSKQHKTDDTKTVDGCLNDRCSKLSNCNPNVPADFTILAGYGA